MPSTGLRGYPFLAQVCRKWKRLLATTMAKQLIWRRLCIDLGHELVTSIHAPLRWSNQRPSNEEYKLAMRKTRVSAIKVLRFLGDVAPHVRTLSLANTGEYDGEDGLYVSLQGKHNFGPTHLGFALALLRNTLTVRNANGRRGAGLGDTNVDVLIRARISHLHSASSKSQRRSPKAPLLVAHCKKGGRS
ncbi:hypothetical protein Vretimale_18439 [Volvox reticuliferus]|nr:hypothetical protein Vretimale_18439 [Volvox reticuliferus]